jgi:hypothetical protein
MNSRTVLAVIAAALIFGAIGYYYGKRDLTDEPFATPGAISGEGSERSVCVEERTVTFVPGASPRLEIAAPKDIEVQFPGNSPALSAICWELSISDDDYRLFSSVHVIQVSNLLGKNNKPILTGQSAFGKNRRVMLRFYDTPNWANGPEHRIGYKVVGYLAAGGEIEADPEIVIKP